MLMQRVWPAELCVKEKVDFADLFGEAKAKADSEAKQAAAPVYDYLTGEKQQATVDDDESGFVYSQLTHVRDLQSSASLPARTTHLLTIGRVSAPVLQCTPKL